MAELSIPEDFLTWLVQKAREFEFEDVVEGQAEDESDEAPGMGVPKDRAVDPIKAEMTSAIEDLNDRQQSELVALVWTGRAVEEGDQPDEFETLVETAAEERVNKTSVYLLGMPMLADYLTEGAAALEIELDV